MEDWFPISRDGKTNTAMDERIPPRYRESGLNDPILRCKDCTKMVHRQFIHTHGCCNHCGNKRFTQVSLITESDMKALQDGTYNFEIGAYTLDPEFLQVFEEVGANA